MLIRQTLLYLPAQLLGPLVQFIAALIWTHFLATHDYGDLMIILSAQELIFLLCLAWWTHYTMRYLAEITKTQDKSQFQAQENSILLVTSVLQAIATLIIVHLFVENLTGILTVLTVLYTITRCLLTHLAERARLRGRILDYSITQMIGPVCGTIIGFMLLYSGNGDVNAVLTGFVLAQLVSLVIVWWRLGFGISFAKPSFILLKAAFNFGLPLLLAGGLAWLSMNGIRLIVEHVRGAEAVGLLSVGWGLGQRAISVVAMLVTAASYPLALRHMNEGARVKSFEQVSLNGALLIGIILPSMIGLLAIGSMLVKLMVGAAFQEATLVILPIAVVAAGLRNMRVHFLDQVFILSEKPSTLMAINAVEAVATVLACWAGLILYDLAGAAWGCLVGTVFGLVLCWWFASQQGLKMPMVHLIKIAIASSIMAIAIYSITLDYSYKALIIKVIIGASIYFIAHAFLYWKSLRIMFKR